MVRYSENYEIKKGKFYGIGELDQRIADMDKDRFNKVAQLKDQNEVKMTDMQDHVLPYL